MPAPDPRLKPCPFCGGHGELITGDDGSVFVHCLSCGADGGWWMSEGNAVRVWNMRVEEKPHE